MRRRSVKTCPGGAAIPHVRVSGLNMYYESHGEGEPLLLIAGLGGDVGDWRFQIPELSRKYRVVVFDNRGAGRTDSPDLPYSIRMMSDDTVGLLDALGIDSAHVVGVSMGGYVAQELAIRYPGRVRSLILASTAAGPYLLETPILNAWAATALDGVSKETFFQIMLPFIFTDKLSESEEMVQMAIDLIAMNRSDVSCGLARQLIACVEHNARGRIGRIAVPALVLAGRDDAFVPFTLSEELASSIPNGRLQVVEGGGHGASAEAPGRFNQAVLEFLAQIAW